MDEHNYYFQKPINQAQLPLLFLSQTLLSLFYSMRVQECPQPAYKDQFSTNYPLLWKLLHYFTFEIIFCLWNSCCPQVWRMVQFFSAEFLVFSSLQVSGVFTFLVLCSRVVNIHNKFFWDPFSYKVVCPQEF